MDPLATYLQERYPAEAAERTRLRSDIIRVARFLVETYRLGWPYQLAAGRDREPPARSASTTAMIVFALDAVGGGVDESVLVPGLRDDYLQLPPKDLAALDMVLARGLKRLATAS